MYEDAPYDYEALQKVLVSALSSLEPLRISRDRLTIFAGRRFSGGYGVVVKASLKGQGPDLSAQAVAIKKLRMSEDDDLRITVRLVREMKLWAELKHPNIVPFIGFHIGEDVSWLISDWAPNGNVQEFLAESEVDSATRLGIVMDVANGLVYLHGLNPPICHGDIKPGNILINHEIRGMLADFGLSRALQANSTGLTTSKTIKGSLRYMSPELLMQNASHTLASDVWAFGCVALEILTSTPPFDEYQGEPQILLQLVQGTPPALMRGQLANALGAELRQLLDCCWKMSSELRPTMEGCLRAIRLQSPTHGFELVTVEGVSAHFDAEVFPEFDLECLQRNVILKETVFLSDGERYLFVDSLNIIKSVDIKTNTEYIVTPNPCRYYAWEAECRYFALLQNGIVTIWNSTSNNAIFCAPLPLYIPLPSNRPYGSRFCISGDGRILTVVDNAGGALYIWNISSGSICNLRLKVRKTGARDIELSFDGRYAALPEIGHGVEIYDTRSLQFVTHLQEEYQGHNLVSWTQHSQKVVVGASHWIKIWDMDVSEEPSNEISSSPSKMSAVSYEGISPCWMSLWHPERVNEIHMSRDDALLVTICGQRRVTVWDLSLGTCHLVINLTQSSYHAIYVSPIPSEEQKRYGLMLRFGENIWRAELTRKKADVAEKVIEGSGMEYPAP